MTEDVNLDFLLEDQPEGAPQQDPPEQPEEVALENEEGAVEQPEEVKEEIPMEDTPPVEPPAEVPAEEPPPAQIDYKALFGEQFSDVDSVKAQLEKAAELEKKISEQKPLKFANETLQRLNNILLTAPEMDLNAAYRLSSLTQQALESMDDASVVRLKHQLDNPEIAENDRLISRLMGREYATMPPQDQLDEMTDDEVQDIKDKVALDAIRMKRDAAKARKQFNDVIEASQQVIDDTSEPPKPDKAEIRQQWEPHAKQIIPKEFEIPVGDEKIKYAVDQAEFAKISDAVLQHVTDNAVPYSKQAFDALSQSMVERYIYVNLPKIVKVAEDNIKAKVKLELERENSNPSALADKKETMKRETDEVNFSPLLD